MLNDTFSINCTVMFVLIHVEIYKLGKSTGEIRQFFNFYIQ